MTADAVLQSLFHEVDLSVGAMLAAGATTDDLQIEFEQVLRSRYPELSHKALTLFALWLTHHQMARAAALARIPKLLEQRDALADRRKLLQPGPERDAIQAKIAALVQEISDIWSPPRGPQQLGEWG